MVGLSRKFRLSQHVAFGYAIRFDSKVQIFSKASSV